jgi:hypothetical protein
MLLHISFLMKSPAHSFFDPWNDARHAEGTLRIVSLRHSHDPGCVRIIWTLLTWNAPSSSLSQQGEVPRCCSCLVLPVGETLQDKHYLTAGRGATSTILKNKIAEQSSRKVECRLMIEANLKQARVKSKMFKIFDKGACISRGRHCMVGVSTMQSPSQTWVYFRRHIYTSFRYSIVVVVRDISQTGI